MTETTQNLTTLNRTEANTLNAFIYQVDNWRNQHGEKADKIKITYYADDEGFEVENGEKDNGVLKRNRATLFRTSILAWAANQLQQLQGWNNDTTVTDFTCVFENDEFGILVNTVPTSEYEKPQTDEMDAE